jgi:hypothetical protein
VAAGVLYALHPGEIDSSRYILTETLFTFLLMATMFAVVVGSSRGRVWLSAVGGATLGLTILCRPIALPFVLLVPLMVALVARPPRFGAHAAAFVACAALVVGPWAVRCSLLADSLVLVQGHSTANFYVPTRYDWDQRDQEQLWHKLATEDEWGRMMETVVTPRDDIAVDRVGLQYAISNILADPVAYVTSRLRTYPHLFLTSFDKFTGLNTSFGTLAAAGRLAPLALKSGLLVVFSLVPLLLAIIGLRARRWSLAGALAALVWVFVALVHMPMWIEYRFWLPAVPFMLVTAPAGAAALVPLLTRRLRPSSQQAEPRP